MRHVILIALAAAAAAADHTLLDPTPEAQMRPFAPDRPDATEGAITVDAGHLYLESSVLTFGHDTPGDARVDTVGFAETELRLGLTDRLEGQVIVRPYERVRVRVGGAKDSVSGIGDTDIRAKWNFWGNEGEETALGVIPFVTCPPPRRSSASPTRSTGCWCPTAWRSPKHSSSASWAA